MLSDNKVLSPTGIDIGGLLNISLTYNVLPSGSHNQRVGEVAQKLHIRELEPLQNGTRADEVKEILQNSGLSHALNNTFITLHTERYNVATLWEVVDDHAGIRVQQKMELAGYNIAAMSDPQRFYMIHQNSKKQGLRINRSKFTKRLHVVHTLAGTKSWNMLNFKSTGRGNTIDINPVLLQAYVKEFDPSMRETGLQQYDIGNSIIMSRMNEKSISYDYHLPEGPFTFMAFGSGLINIDKKYRGICC